MSASSQLLERCLAGDPASIEAVFQTYRRPVFRLAYAALLDPAAAGNATQAGLNSVLGALRTGMTEEDFQRLLYQHVLRACTRERQRSLLRRLLRLSPRPTETAASLAPPPAPPPAHPPPSRSDPQRRAAMWQAVCALPAEQRVALTLRCEFDLPVPAIARILRMGPGGVHARLSAARRSITQTLSVAESAR